MAFFENAVERAAALATTCGRLAMGGGLEAAVGVTVGAAGLAAVVSSTVRKHGPESEAVLAKIRARIRDDLEAFAKVENWDSRPDLEEADKAMERALAGVFLGRSELAASARTSQGFPEAATEMMLQKLAEREPDIFGPRGSTVAKNYTRRVIRTALEAAIDNEDYFRKLEPHLLIETLHGLGVLEQKVDAVHDAVEDTQKMVLELLRRVPGSDTYIIEKMKVEFGVNDRSEALCFHAPAFPWPLEALHYFQDTMRMSFYFSNGFSKDFGIPSSMRKPTTTTIGIGWIP